MENKKDQAINQKLYRLTDLQEILGVTYRTLLNYLKDGKLKGAFMSGHWIISQQNLDDFINGKNESHKGKNKRRPTQ